MPGQPVNMLTALKREFFLCVRGGRCQSDLFLRRMIPPGSGYSPVIVALCHYLRTPPAASGLAYHSPLHEQTFVDGIRCRASRDSSPHYHHRTEVQCGAQVHCHKGQPHAHRDSTAGIPQPDTTLEGNRALPLTDAVHPSGTFTRGCSEF